MDQNELKARTKEFALRTMKLLLKEANELTAIFAKSIKSAKNVGQIKS